MGIFDNLRDRHMTDYITINSRNCVACWDCFTTCPKQVFGKIDFLGHRHIKIKNVSACIGCNKCVQVCQHGAIKSRK